MFVKRACYASVLFAIWCFGVACANDQTALPELSCELMPCEASCVLPSCEDGGADVTGLVDVTGRDASATGDAPNDPLADDTPEESDAGGLDADDPEPDGVIDEEVDSGEVVEGSGDVSPLFTICDTNADCPLPGTVCLKEFPLSHRSSGSERAAFEAQEVFGSRFPEDRGVCSASCVSPMESCQFTDVSGLLVVWECQLIAVDERVHPGVDPGWLPDYPLAEPLDEDDMLRGQPFAAICRPDGLQSRGVPLCAPCSRDADCGSGVCWDPAESAGTESVEGFTQSYCVDGCASDDDCSFGFSCQRVGEESLCLPLAGTCGKCLDLDGDRYGVGRCTRSETVSAVDCNDRDALTYYRGSDGLPEPSRCSADADSNCNGVNDDAELVGPGPWGSLHCRSCGDICDDTVADDALLVNGAIVCRESESGDSECGPDCAPGFADCNGILADGCETATGTDSDCDGCGDSCASFASGALVGVCSGTLDGLASCVIAECPPGTADCNGVFEDGCETDTVSSLQNCGGCEADCTDLFAQAIEGCVDSQCTIASCASGFADCDRWPETGCEADIRVDESHCGSCGRVCALANAQSECVSSTCMLVDCLPGYANCDGVRANGCEANLNINPTHCGGCNQTCSIPGATAVCISGECELARCASGLLDCSATSLGCETDGTRVGNCGACGESCESIPLGLRACVSNTTRTLWACQCDDSRFSRQECDGEFNRCDESVDEGCPTALGRVGARTTSIWGVTSSSSSGMVVEQSIPTFSTFTINRYLYGLELDWDESAVIQIRPLWLDTNPLTGVGAGRDYPFYRLTRALDESYIRSSTALGVPDASINTAALTVAGVDFTLDFVLSCPRASGAPSHAFALPVAVRLYSGLDDSLLSGVGLLCQTYEIRFVSAFGSDPTAWYDVVPYGAVRTAGPVGPGRRFRQQIPEYISGDVGNPIIGLNADINYTSWPQFLGGIIRQSVSVFKALRVVNAVSWGLL